MRNLHTQHFSNMQHKKSYESTLRNKFGKVAVKDSISHNVKDTKHCLLTKISHRHYLSLDMVVLSHLSSKEGLKFPKAIQYNLLLKFCYSSSKVKIVVCLGASKPISWYYKQGVRLREIMRITSEVCSYLIIFKAKPYESSTMFYFTPRIHKLKWKVTVCIIYQNRSNL